MGYLSLLCCNTFHVEDVCIFHISSFSYRREVTVCIRLEAGNPLRFCPRGKNLAFRLCSDIFIKVMLTYKKSKRQEIYQQIAALKAGCVEFCYLCGALFSKLAT